MVAMDPEDVEAGEEDNSEDDNDDEQDEGVGVKGAVIQVASGECSGHRR